jgi:hypothetical protein
MPRPTTACERATRLGFFRQPEDPEAGLVFDERVAVRRVICGVFGHGSAELDVNFHGLMRRDETVIQEEISDADFNTMYGPRVECAIGILPDEPDDLAGITFVARGFLDARMLQLGSAGNQVTYNRSLRLRDCLHRAAGMRSAQIQGRYMLSQAAWDTLAAEDPPSEDPVDMAWEDLAKYVRALPCIFNAGGKPNRMKRPVLFKPTDQLVHEGPIHLFTYEGDPQAEYWTLLQALRYLVRVHLPFDPENSPPIVGPGNLFTAEDRTGPEDEWWYDLAEGDVPEDEDRPVDSWLDLTVRRADNLTVEGLSIEEALKRLAKAAGIYWSVVHLNDSEEDEVFLLSELNFWAPADGAVVELGLERDGGYLDGDGEPRAVTDILAANNVVNANLQVDYGNTLRRVVVIGDKKWRVVRAALVPLWKPDERWDDVDEGDKTTFRDQAYSSSPFATDTGSEFFNRFQPDGPNHGDGQNRLVGRLWGIDASGEIAAVHAEYDRETGAFTDYSTPWDFEHEADQVRRRRKVGPVPTADGKAIGVLLEVSLDAGSSWHRVADRLQVIAEQSAFYIAARDLLSFGKELFESLDPASEYDNYYHAFMEQAFLLRAYFAIETDEVCTGEGDALFTSPVAEHDSTALVLRNTTFKELATDVEATTAPEVDALGTARDDTAAANKLAASLLATRVRGKWAGEASIPWIEEEEFPLGARVSGIRRGPTEVIAFNTIVDDPEAPIYGALPIITQKVYQVDAQTTMLTLDDAPLLRGMESA